MALRHVDITGLKAAACKYCTSSAVISVWYMLLSSCVGRVVGIFLFLLLFFNGTLLNPVQFPLFLMMIFCPFCLIVTSSLSNNAVQPASNHFTMHISEQGVKPGITCASLVVLGSCQSFRLQSLEDMRFVPSGRPIIIAGTYFVFLSCGYIVFMYVPLAPVSAIPVGFVL